MSEEKEEGKNRRGSHLSQNRASIEVADLRELVARASNERFWPELSFSKQCRILLLERLAQIFPEEFNEDGTLKDPNSDPPPPASSGPKPKGKGKG